MNARERTTSTRRWSVHAAPVGASTDSRFHGDDDGHHWREGKSVILRVYPFAGALFFVLGGVRLMNSRWVLARQAHSAYTCLFRPLAAHTSRCGWPFFQRAGNWSAESRCINARHGFL